jgi:hypothetical protein
MRLSPPTIAKSGSATPSIPTVERYFLDVQTGHEGVCQHCSEKHLDRFLAEFDFRYSPALKRIRRRAVDEANNAPIVQIDDATAGQTIWPAISYADALTAIATDHRYLNSRTARGRIVAARAR